MTDSTDIIPGTSEYKVMMSFILHNKPVKPSDIAHTLDIPHQTIDSALIRLKKQGYIVWEKYKQISLTDKGKDKLQHLEMHIHLIEIYLMDTLKLTGRLARNEALALAPHVSCELIKRICTKYSEPKMCPNHDQEIFYCSSCHTHEDKQHEMDHENHK